MAINLEALDQEVSKEKLKLKATVSGISHSGKTMSGLMLAKSLAGDDMSKVLAIDCGERNGVSVYDYMGKFRTIKLPPPFTLDKITDCVNYAIGKGYQAVLFDSLTQFWSGIGGLVEQAEKIGLKNSPWNKLISQLKMTMLQCLDADIHIIFTLRQKSDKVEEKDEITNKRKFIKVGMKDDFKPDADYDFDLCLEMNREHQAVIHKDRTHICPDNEVFAFTSELADQIADWTKKGKRPINTKRVLSLFSQYPKDAKFSERISDIIKTQSVDWKEDVLAFVESRKPADESLITTWESVRKQVEDWA